MVEGAEEGLWAAGAPAPRAGRPLSALFIPGRPLPLTHVGLRPTPRLGRSRRSTGSRRRELVEGRGPLRPAPLPRPSTLRLAQGRPEHRRGTQARRARPARHAERMQNSCFDQHDEPRGGRHLIVALRSETARREGTRISDWREQPPPRRRPVRLWTASPLDRMWRESLRMGRGHCWRPRRL